MENKMNEFTEYWYHQTLGLRVKIKAHLHSEQSKYQKIDVYETEGIGKLLTLNGKTMVSEIDEFIYHEIMAHVPCAVARKNSKVLIIGGGDGGVVREFAKHNDVQSIDLVEIDDRVIEISKKYFPQCTSALGDPRVKIHARDGAEFIKERKNYYDIIIVDSTDPEDFALGLFTEKFYREISEALTSEGIMMAQTENPILDEFEIKKFYDNLRAVFPVVESFSAPIIIYPGVYWSFAFASKCFHGTDLNPDSTKKNKLKQIEKDCRWYNSNWHIGTFALSNLHRKQVGM
ncbi:MAG: polyamine aminopropyltransferase [Oligoflexia bacterium]|nr:polyamine aminopropyltransferase [Oligoflexia bacterium]